MGVPERPMTKSKPGCWKKLVYTHGCFNPMNPFFLYRSRLKPPYGMLSSHQFSENRNGKLIEINHIRRVEPFFPALGWLSHPCGEGAGKNELQRARGHGEMAYGGKAESWLYTVLWLKLTVQMTKKFETGPTKRTIFNIQDLRGFALWL